MAFYWGIVFLIILIILIIVLITIYIKQTAKQTQKQTQKHNIPILAEPFLAINDKQLYNLDEDNKGASTIETIIPAPQNQLSDIQLQNTDTNILRNVRVLKLFSMNDEIDYYQMYNLLKIYKTQKDITFNLSSDDIAKTQPTQPIQPTQPTQPATNKIYNVLNEENKNNVIYVRIKLELISLLNKLIISKGYYLPYHQYDFLKITNSNLISKTSIPTPTTTNDMYIDNYIFTLTIGREHKYQSFTIYYDIDIIKNTNTNTNTNTNGTGSMTQITTYTIRINKIELIGLPLQKTFEPNNNNNSSSNSSSSSSSSSINSISNSISNNIITPNKDGKLFESQYIKYINDMEKSDMNTGIFDVNVQKAFIENHKLDIATSTHKNNHKCFGLVNGKSKELISYNNPNNPIFCESYHPEISQNGVLDAPCQVNSDCPFYKANTNYPNEFGKCDTNTGQCEMPLGIIPIGFTKYGKTEPDCYNCDSSFTNNKCCKLQFNNININKSDLVNSQPVKYSSPDYIFNNDEAKRKQYANLLTSQNLHINPSI